MLRIVRWTLASALLAALSWPGHSMGVAPSGVALASGGCAAPAATFPSGNGSSTPFAIATAADLELLRDDSRYWDDSFVLTADITLSNCTWTSTIGDDTVGFTGNFDGGGKYLRGMNVTITGDYGANDDGGVAGVFGVMGPGSSLRDLNVIGAVSANTVGASDFAYAGGIVGRANGTSISGSSFTGTVTAQSAANHPYAGGIVGEGADLRISSVAVRADVSAAPAGRAAAGGVAGALSASSPGLASIDKAFVVGSIFTESGVQASSGGIAGWTGPIEISRSFAEVKVRADNGAEPAAGGIVGGGSANVTNSYARGDIVGTRMVGGVIGWSTQADAVNFALRNSYFTGTLTLNSGDRRALGGLVGRGDRLSTVDYQAPGSVWNQQSSGVPDAIGYAEYINGGVPNFTLDPVAAGAVSSNTSGMRTESTYTNAGWSIDDTFNLGVTWNICSGANDGYPILSSFFAADPCGGQVVSPSPSSQSVPGTIGLSFSTDPIAVAGVADPFFTVSPSLPAGWSLNPLTGVISGTRAYAASDSTYTITAVSPVPLQRGTATVVMEATPAPTVTPANQTISGVLGTVVATSALTVTDLPGATFTIAPALPAGLNLNGATGEVTGTVQVPVASTTVYTITAASGGRQATSTLTQTATPSSPTITSVQPSSGTTAGGTTVTITGTEFEPGATVTFGGVAGTVTALTATQISVVTPPASAGAVDVAVVNVDTGSAVSLGTFTFVAPSPPRPPRPLPTPTPTPTPSPSPSPSPSPAPVPLPVPETSVQTGEVLVSIDGQVDPNVSMSPGRDNRGLRISGSDFAVSLGGVGPDGRDLRIGSDGALLVQAGRPVRTSGSGFLPNSPVAVYLSPLGVDGRTWLARVLSRALEPILLGVLITDSQGNYAGSATLPRTAPPGPHALQSVGWSPGRQARAVTIGIRVTPSLDATAGPRSPRGKSDRVRLTGRVAGLEAGTVLTPYFRFGTTGDFRKGDAGIVVRADGSFAWSRLVRKSKAFVAYVSFQETDSNQVSWAPLKVSLK